MIWLNNFLSFFFKLLYHSFSWSYDLVSWIVSLGRWQDWIYSVLPYIQGPLVLELGFGPGHLLFRLTQNGIKVFGLDESLQMALISHRRLLKSSPSSAAKIARGIGQSLPFPNAAFKTIVATFPTNYIFNPQTLLEMNRVLVDDGQVVILLAVWFTGASLLEKAEAFLYKITRQVPPFKTEYPEIISLFDNAGLNSKIMIINRPKDRLLLLTAEKKSKQGESLK